MQKCIETEITISMALQYLLREINFYLDPLFSVIFIEVNVEMYKIPRTDWTFNTLITRNLRYIK